MWVPFIMGRPFGVPDDPAFQRRVLTAVLRLLEAPAGPLLVEFPEEAPQPVAGEAAAEEAEGFACPVSFSRAPGGSGLAATVQREIAELTTWYDMTREKRGGSKVSLSGLTPAAAAKFITDFIDNPKIQPYRENLTIDFALRLAFRYGVEFTSPMTPVARRLSALFCWYSAPTAILASPPGNAKIGPSMIDRATNSCCLVSCALS